jgi:hypothetical protein
MRTVFVARDQVFSRIGGRFGVLSHRPRLPGEKTLIKLDDGRAPETTTDSLPLLNEVEEYYGDQDEQ